MACAYTVGLLSRDISADILYHKCDIACDSIEKTCVGFGASGDLIFISGGCVCSETPGNAFNVYLFSETKDMRKKKVN